MCFFFFSFIGTCTPWIKHKCRALLWWTWAPKGDVMKRWCGWMWGWSGRGFQWTAAERRTDLKFDTNEMIGWWTMLQNLVALSERVNTRRQLITRKWEKRGRERSCWTGLNSEVSGHFWLQSVPRKALWMKCYFPLYNVTLNIWHVHINRTQLCLTSDLVLLLLSLWWHCNSCGCYSFSLQTLCEWSSIMFEAWGVSTDSMRRTL